jgi:uncharacterized membrane protein
LTIDALQPALRRVGFAAPFTWLAAGWHDLWRQPATSLFYGVCVAIVGAVILAVTAQLPYLFTVAVSGFMLVAPLLATGLYELSRRYLAAEEAPLGASMRAWQRNPAGLLGFGLLSLLAVTAWQVISVVMIALYYSGPALAPLDLILEILRDPDHTLLFLAYIGVGGLIAALVFAASVVTVPMLLDRRCDLITALSTSLAAVAENPQVLAFWALLIMLLTLVGFATFLLGFVVILPWLGHASFHAYKALVE